MAELRIRVGAYVDRSFEAVLTQIEAATKRSQAKVTQGTAASTALVVRQTRTQGAAMSKSYQDAEARFAALAASISGKSTAMLAPGTAAVQRFGSESKKNFDLAMRGFQAAGRSAEDNFRRIGKAQRDLAIAEKVHPLFRERQLSPGAQSVVRGVRTGFGAARQAAGFAAGIARDVAAGAGVDFSLSSMVAKNVDLETRATDLSNAGFMPGAEGANGRRVSPRELMKQARDLGNRTGFSSSSVIEGLQGFVGKTGDLETGRAVLEDLAKLSRATGTNFEDMVNAAGDVSTTLGDIPNKGEAVAGVMRSIAGQGKLGAVEIKDLAVQMAKIAAAAGQFEGDPKENVALLGAFAQESRQRGGSASATQAATSVGAMLSTFKTPARVAAFKANGIDVTTSSGMVRNPKELVIEALRAQGMDPVKFKSMFANVAGARAVEGFATIYRQAGGGQAGEDAVRAEFARLEQAAMGAGEILESFNASLRTTEAQANIFNNKMQETAGEMQSALLPALIALSPAIIEVTKGISGWVAKFFGSDKVENEKDAGGAALTGMNLARDLERQLRSGSVNEDALEKGRSSLDEMKKARARIQGTILEEHEDAPQRFLDKEGKPMGQYGGYLTESDEIKASQIRSHETMKADLDEAIQRLEQSTKDLTRGLLYEGIKVREMPAPPAKPPAHSPGGRTGPDAGAP